jgi:hypothetical protein
MLLVVVAVVAAMAILKGTRQQAIRTPPAPEAAAVQEAAQSNPSGEGLPNVAAPATVEDTQTLVQKITDIQAEGYPTPGGRAVLLAALSAGKDKEVRQAALNAIVQLDDTVAIPGLEQALPQIADAREKAAVMDAIEQLKLPSSTPEVAVSGNMRSQPPPPGSKPIKFNPLFGGKGPRGPNTSLRAVQGAGQPVAAPDAGQPATTPGAGQPAAAPDTGQPASAAPQ